MEIAMQRMVEVHTEMMRVLTQDMVNRDSNEIPPGMQQVLEWSYLNSTNDVPDYDWHQ
jgi:hypothetical protein